MTLYLQFQGTPFSHVLEAMPPMAGMCPYGRGPLRGGRLDLLDEYVAPSIVEAPGSRLDDAGWLDKSSRFHRDLRKIAGHDVIDLVGGAIAFVFADRVKFDEHPRWTPRERRRVHNEHPEIAQAVRSGMSSGPGRSIRRMIRALTVSFASTTRRSATN
jgi:hypothetical protein